ncbi:hypothetical protein [Paraburkholderia tuberum]|uniref:hypothetical protein n=1 Tax=Paraburkholderia TaxID=1822464 RepID=UPI0013A6C9EB|nr:hypothetical protein [Paraburkholderia tuberum]MDH6150498.1 hypothetical protein [Paraburkholderia sp. WSM4179]
MSEMQEKALEARARRAARSVDLVATKSRQRQHCDNLGRFQLVDQYVNMVVEGVRYELTPEDVIEFCAERKA